MEDKSHPELCQAIADRIQVSQRITFSEFMELALYHPQHGYYSRQCQQIGGGGGDFFTSPHLGSEFGELIAVQLVEMWERLDQPTPFTVVEMGAGQGLLAQDILGYLAQQAPTCFAATVYWIVEQAPALIQAQQRLLQPWRDRGCQIEWRSWEHMAQDSVTGVFLSNELVDALPVHRVRFDGGQLQEIYVTQQDGKWLELYDRPSTPALATYFENLGIDLTRPEYQDNYCTEVNLAAIAWLQRVASCLRQGFILTIDYGYPADRYYNRVRSQGTLQCYFQHQHHNDPYLHVGNQDITSHVDFTTLEQQGEQLGLTTVGRTQQAMFLMALGLGDRLTALSQSTTTDPQKINQILRRRDALHLLVNPMNLGNFGVLIQSKGLAQEIQKLPLKGLTIPAFGM
ncbi:MAG: SAM-dependent methyltransferase [Synechococcales bacterium]|nr:SAM-dependent methyltransferase [Synechococcales bacterium]